MISGPPDVEFNQNTSVPKGQCHSKQRAIYFFKNPKRPSNIPIYTKQFTKTTRFINILVIVIIINVMYVVFKQL